MHVRGVVLRACTGEMVGQFAHVACLIGTHMGMCWLQAVVQAGCSAAQICAHSGDKLRHNGDDCQSLVSGTQGKVCQGIAPSCWKMPCRLEAGLQACWVVEQHLTTRGADSFAVGWQGSHRWRQDHTQACRLSHRECSHIGQILRAVGIGAAAHQGWWKDALDNL